MKSLIYSRQLLINSLIIVENLKSNDLKTGQRLYEDLQYKVWAQGNFNLEYHNPQSAAEFVQLLLSIKDRVQNHGVYPWLHLEIHGNTKGLAFGDSEELLKWETIRPILIEINTAIKFNLFISLAVCFGAYILIEILDIGSTAPFMGCYASEKTETAGDIEKVFTQFYDEFFSSWKLQRAVQKVRDNVSGTKFQLYQSENLFLRSYVFYLRRQLTPASMEKRWKKYVESQKIRGNAKLKRKKRREYLRHLQDDTFNRAAFVKTRNDFFGLNSTNEEQYANLNYDALKKFSKILKKR